MPQFSRTLWCTIPPPNTSIQPVCLQSGAAFSAALEAADIDLNARLREREIARAETCLYVAAEDRLYKLVEHTLKVAERDLLIDNKGLPSGGTSGSESHHCRNGIRPVPAS